MATQPLAVSSAFLKSLEDARVYPQNLLDRQNYSASLKSYQTRLGEASPRLFAGTESDAEIHIRDFDSATQKFSRTWVYSQHELRRHLHIEQGSSSTASTPSLTVHKKDPKCRFVFLMALSGRSPLRITKEMLLQLLTYHQISPTYLDFLFLFGLNSGANDLRFSGFREQTCLRQVVSLQGLAAGLSELGRSGMIYELCYNLKSVYQKVAASPDLLDPIWSIRQAAVYHKFDVKHGTTLWMITQGSEQLKNQVQEVTGKDGRPEDRCFSTVEDCFRASLGIHSMLVHWACESWRWYLQWLDEAIERETELVLYGTREKVTQRKWFTAEDLQRVQKHEDQVNAAAMAVDSNVHVITALKDYYESLVKDVDFHMNNVCEGYVAQFARQTMNGLYDLKMQAARARALSQHACERKSLILQYMQAQTAEKQEELTDHSLRISISAQSEAIAMRIITVVTLIFLPATFVSTFFSTDVVKFQGQNGPGNVAPEGAYVSYSRMAMRRWLEVTLPLTAVTLTVAFGAFWWEKQRRDRNQARQLERLQASKA